MSEKTSYKTIEFLEAHYEIAPICSSKMSPIKNKLWKEEIINNLKVESIILHENEETKTPKVAIDILEIENNEIFGSIGGFTSIKEVELTKIGTYPDESNQTNKDNINYFINNYTFFLYNFQTNKILLLSNSKAPSFRMHFRNLLFKKIIEKQIVFDNVNIYPIKDTQIDKRLKELSKMKGLKLILKNPDAIGEMSSLREIHNLSQNQLERVKIEITVDKESLTSEEVRNLTDDEIIGTNFEELKVTGIDAEENKVILDLVEKIMTKTIVIEIPREILRSQDIDQQLNPIKNALKNEMGKNG